MVNPWVILAAIGLINLPVGADELDFDEFQFLTREPGHDGRALGVRPDVGRFDILYDDPIGTFGLDIEPSSRPPIALPSGSTTRIVCGPGARSVSWVMPCGSRSSRSACRSHRAQDARRTTLERLCRGMLELHFAILTGDALNFEIGSRACDLHAFYRPSVGKNGHFMGDGRRERYLDRGSSGDPDRNR